jgi:GNAT superfamily N-acetyltransferase
MIVVPLVQRPGVPADLAFVYNSWLRGMREAWPEMRSEDYFALQHQRIERLLTGPGDLVVLHPEKAPAVIGAWALYDQGNAAIVHYVHVRGEYRGQRHASNLLKGRTIATHMTAQGRGLKRRLGVRYMPHLLDGLGG